jgi:predicted transposase/invertase (TIGR01784 family)
MSFDNTCRRLAEQFPQDFATWLLGEPVDFTVLQPTELSNEPIRADSVILFKSQRKILHIEFQTDPQPNIPLRATDYLVRLHRLFPDHEIVQFVIYLRETGSPLVHQDYFEIPGQLRAQFNVIRLWEVPAEQLMGAAGLLPFAVLGQAADPQNTLRQAVRGISQIENEAKQHEAMAASYVLAGLKLGVAEISQIIRRDVMQASVTYQALLEEGRQEGREKGLEEGRQAGLQAGLQVGRQEGRQEGQQRLILRQLASRVGVVPAELSQHIQALTGSQLEDLAEQLLDFRTLDDLTAWFQAQD